MRITSDMLHQAWQLAREGADRYGGSARDYFPKSMQIVLAEHAIATIAVATPDAPTVGAIEDALQTDDARRARALWQWVYDRYRQFGLTIWQTELAIATVQAAWTVRVVASHRAAQSEDKPAARAGKPKNIRGIPYTPTIDWSRQVLAHFQAREKELQTYLYERTDGDRDAVRYARWLAEKRGIHHLPAEDIVWGYNGRYSRNPPIVHYVDRKPFDGRSGKWARAVTFRDVAGETEVTIDIPLPSCPLVQDMSETETGTETDQPLPLAA